ncbi:MAG: permease [Actinobacteria bacterium]|jgi:FtsH-binding integral membrane protein|nr:Bax inhibitor-1 family protein [Actinomycetota bacterium]PLS84790.1 MAG: permease [Actinomycetota bacterium]
MALNTSYGSRRGAAAYALPDERAGFIRRTYAHLAGAILAFVLLEMAIFATPAVRDTLVGLLTQSWLLTLALFIGASWVADRWARSDASRGLQYVGLGVYVALQALIFVPLLYVALFYVNDPTLIPTAGIITGALFLGLTAIVFTTRADFSFLRGALVVGSLVALGLIVASLLFGFSLGVIFSVAMVGLAAISILYSTSNVLHYYRTDQYVAASLSLFAAVALLFYYVVRILIAMRR